MFLNFKAGRSLRAGLYSLANQANHGCSSRPIRVTLPIATSSPTAKGNASPWNPQSNTKGSALVIPLLPPRARERGAEKLPHTPQRRLFQGGGVQGCAAPVLPFAGTVRLFRRAGSAALDRIGHGAGGLDQAEQEQRFQGVSEHGSALQMECFAHGHKGRGFPAVVHNVPVLRRTPGRIVFRAEGTGTAEPAAIFQIGQPRGPAVRTRRRAVQWDGLPCGPAHRAAAVWSVGLAQVIRRRHGQLPPYLGEHDPRQEPQPAGRSDRILPVGRGSRRP